MASSSPTAVRHVLLDADGVMQQVAGLHAGRWQITDGLPALGNLLAALDVEVPESLP